ncbi:unnamed protein product [Ambrosiozyma monospora]|uniref:Unnamed protein product n=1 Tax=Ambrosiozyma monospora TaxID=43982 RepID=A0ACB5TKD3_AMBMO|nr:unnamed protein product [Ambrosiozyma monospora]
MSSGGAEYLSNDAILGLKDDTTSQQEQQLPEKPVRKVYKLTDEFMLGPRGIPELHKSLKNFKFIKKNKYRSSYEKYKQGSYGASYQFQNLTNLLYVYQKWGHDIYPKYKFTDVIPVINKASSTPLTKQYKRKLILDEIGKVFATKNGQDDQQNNNDIDANTNGNSTTTSNGNTTKASSSTQETTNPLFVGGIDSDEELYTPSDLVHLRSKSAEQQKQSEKEKEADVEDDDDDDDFLRELNKGLTDASNVMANNAKLTTKAAGNQDITKNDQALVDNGTTTNTGLDKQEKDKNDDDNDEDMFSVDDDGLLDEVLNKNNKNEATSQAQDEFPTEFMEQYEEEDPELAIMREMGM